MRAMVAVVVAASAAMAATLGIAAAARVPDAAIDPRLRTMGVIFPRLSPDGLTIALSYQGAIWRMPASGARRVV